MATLSSLLGTTYAGPQGPVGSPGAAATIAVGTTTTGNAGTSAAVTNSGTSSAAVFNFTIPRGSTPTVAVGAVSTSGNASGSVTNSGTSTAAVFDFVLPRSAIGYSYSFRTTAYTAAANDYVIADTSAGAFTITLPAAPTAGQILFIGDFKSTFDTYPITVARNGSTIEGLSQDLSLNIASLEHQFVYQDSTWRVFSRPFSKFADATTPQLIGPTSGAEGSTIVFRISNHNISTGATYSASVTGGTVSIAGDLVYWTLPVVASTTTRNLTVTRTKSGETTLSSTIQVSVVNVTSTADTAAVYTTTTMASYAYNDGWVI